MERTLMTLSQPIAEGAEDAHYRFIYCDKNEAP